MTDSTPPATAAAEHEGPIEFDGAGCRYVLLAMPVIVFDPGQPSGDMPSREMRTADLVALLAANPQLRAAVLEGLGECMRWSIAEERMAAVITKLRLAESELAAEQERVRRAAEIISSWKDRVPYPLRESVRELAELLGSEHLEAQRPLTLADVDRRIAELARAAGDLAGIDHFASRRALERLQEAAKAGKP